MKANQFAGAEDALSFALAGNAYLTLKSLRTGTRYTYRVPLSEDGLLFFVSVLTGPNNGSDYRYIGIIDADRNFHWGKRSTIGRDAPSVRAFTWAYGQLRAGRLPAELEVWHEGRCGRCGRMLTVPESLARGLGPECAVREPRFAAQAA